MHNGYASRTKLKVKSKIELPDTGPETVFYVCQHIGVGCLGAEF